MLLLASPASAFTNCQVSVANVGFLLDACTRGNTSLCSFLPQARERQGEICISPFGMETFPATVARPLRQFMPHESARPVPGYSVQMGAPLP